MAEYKIKGITSQGKKQTISIDNHEKALLKLYWTQIPDKQSGTFLGSMDQGTYEVTRPIDYAPVYYIVEDGNGNRTIVGERTLPIDGTNNFRDMGGYTGADGRTVKWGKLFRSDHLHSITDNGLIFLKKLRIRTIVDYRSKVECEKAPNQWIGEVKTLHLDPAAHTAEIAAQFAAKPEKENEAIIEKIVNHMPPDEVNGSGEQVLFQYRGFTENEKAIASYKALLKAVVNHENSPLLQHCRGGKDRTGFGVMLTLALLGVSNEQIVYDYMLTGKNREKRNAQKLQEYKKLTQDQNVLNYLMSLIETRPEFIGESIRMVEKQCGSILCYIKHVMEITDDEIAAAREFYLV